MKDLNPGIRPDQGILNNVSWRFCKGFIGSGPIAGSSLLKQIEQRGNYDTDHGGAFPAPVHKEI